VTYDLVILAAGLGSRFGGLKQAEPVGPHGELIIDYSACDARRAGFDRAVIVIRRSTEKDFREAVGRHLENLMEVAYVFQELETLPAGFVPPPGRTKPWGTGHALLAAARAVRAPFAVVNADDFYGASSYRVLAEFFRAGGPRHALVGFPLRQTLSEHGAVSRGLCTLGADGRLQGIAEITGIEKTDSGIGYSDTAGGRHVLTGGEIVSMNFWGFTPGVFAQLETLFIEFLRQRGTDPKAEFYLPTSISRLIERGEARVEVLASREAWFGMTFREDLPVVRRAISGLIAEGVYPENLRA
jgi:dTDP-glucose pyrophosphorylase